MTNCHVTRRTVVGLAVSALLSTLGIPLYACADSSQETVQSEADSPFLNLKDKGDEASSGVELSEEQQTLDKENNEGWGAALALAAANAVPFGEEIVLANGDRTAMSGAERTNTKQHGDWIGNMAMCIDRAEIYTSLAAAQAARDLGRVGSGALARADEEGLCYLVVDVHLSNIDSVGRFTVGEAAYAAYTVGMDNPPSPDYLFSSSEFKVVTPDLNGTPGGSYSDSFAGGLQVAGADPNLDLRQYYELAPGEETTLTFGWRVYANTDPSSLYLHTDYIGAHSPYPEVLFDLGLGQDAAGE